jgi:hypothetical protein
MSSLTEALLRAFRAAGRPTPDEALLRAFRAAGWATPEAVARVTEGFRGVLSTHGGASLLREAAMPVLVEAITSALLKQESISIRLPSGTYTICPSWAGTLWRAATDVLGTEPHRALWGEQPENTDNTAQSGPQFRGGYTPYHDLTRHPLAHGFTGSSHPRSVPGDRKPWYWGR